MEGAGFFGDVWNYGKKAVQRVKDIARGVRRDYPPKVRQLLGVIGDAPVVQIYVRRDPIRGPLHTALNLITLGKWDQVRQKYAYDRVFHLGVEVVIQPDPSSPIRSRYVIEKNEVINVSPANAMTQETEIVDVPLSGTTTINLLLQGAQQLQANQFFLYDAFTNNCQDFIEALLRGSGLATADILSFVKQPLEGVIADLPSYIAPVARAATDVAALANVALQGQGRTHRQNFLKTFDLEDKPYSIEELSKISSVPVDILQQVYNRGVGAHSTSKKSVRLKGSYVKNVDAPMSKKLSKEQWGMARLYSFLDGNPKHDNDLRANVEGKGKYSDLAKELLSRGPRLDQHRRLMDRYTRLMMSGEAAEAEKLVPQIKDIERSLDKSHFMYITLPRVADAADWSNPKERVVPTDAALRAARAARTAIEARREAERIDAAARAAPPVRSPGIIRPEARSATAAATFAAPPGAGAATGLSAVPLGFRGRGVGSFQEQLEAIGIKPEAYLKEAKRRAKKAGLDYKTLRFADTGKHKLTITNEKGQDRHFGRIGYGDHLIWTYLEATKKAPVGEASSRRDRFQKSHSKIKGDWKKDPYSPNNLALKVIW